MRFDAGARTLSNRSRWLRVGPVEAFARRSARADCWSKSSVADRFVLSLADHFESFAIIRQPKNGEPNAKG